MRLFSMRCFNRYYKCRPLEKQQSRLADRWGRQLAGRENRPYNLLFKLCAWIPAVFAAGMIIALTLQQPQGTIGLSESAQRWLINAWQRLWPGRDAPAWMMDMHAIRSMAHIPEYAVLGCGLLFACRPSRSGSVRRCCALTLVIGGLAGLADETLKIVLPTREFDLGDWGLDLLGLLLAVGGWLLLKTIRRRYAESEGSEK